MATATPIFPQTVKNGVITIVNATGTANVTSYTAGTSGAKIESWIVTSTDTSDRILNIWYNTSATNYLIGTVNIPLNSGNSTSVPTVDILANLTGLARDSNGNKYIYVSASNLLTISVTVAVTAAKTVTSFIQAGDF